VSFASLRGRGPVDRERLATACHEAGHAVVGCLLGAVLDYAELLEVGPCSAGRFGPERVRGWTRFAVGADGLCRARIAAAGPAAEVLMASQGRGVTVGAVMTALGRRSCAEPARLGVCGVQSDRAQIERQGWADPSSLVSELVPLVGRCWPSVSFVARRLYRGERVGQADVLAALGVRDEGDVPFLAALVRSGLRVPRPLEAVT
jgi:hypothetical protein